MERDPIPFILAYFRTHAARDEAAHLALFDPRVKYFGSVSGVRDEGITSYRGIFRGIAHQYRLNEVIPRRLLGSWPEYVVMVDLHFQLPGEELRALEAVWRFVFAESGLIQELGIFWSPQGPEFLDRRF